MAQALIVHVPDNVEKGLHQRRPFPSAAFNTPGRAPGHDRWFWHANHGFLIYGNIDGIEREIEISLRSLFVNWEKVTEGRLAEFDQRIYPIIRDILRSIPSIDVIYMEKTYLSERGSGNRQTYNCFEPTEPAYAHLISLLAAKGL